MYAYAVKTGKPGILVFDGTKQSNKMFLEHAKGTEAHATVLVYTHSDSYQGLRYLDFHHLDTKLFSEDASLRLAAGKNGLDEIESTNDIVVKLQTIGEKEWFRKEMGMQKGARSSVVVTPVDGLM